MARGTIWRAGWRTHLADHGAHAGAEDQALPFFLLSVVIATNKRMKNQKRLQVVRSAKTLSR
jgi:hypothetical protein